MLCRPVLNIYFLLTDQDERSEFLTRQRRAAMRRQQQDDLEPELLQALGDLVVQHSALEEALRNALWLETTTDKIVVNVLLSGMSCSSLIDKFGAVYYEHHPSRRMALAELCSHLRHLNEQRNTFVHSLWTTGAGSRDAMRQKLSANPKQGLVLRSEGVSASAIREVAQALTGATNKVWELITELSL